MTLFTKEDCQLCKQLLSKFDLTAMEVNVEVLDGDNAEALAHLAWHSLVEAARKSLPLLVLDDSSTIIDFVNIEHHLIMRASRYGLDFLRKGGNPQKCDNGSCTFH